MKAAVLERFDEVVVTTAAEPEPGPGEVIVRIRASGVCRTDLKVIEGAIPTVQPPMVIGHEPAGEVAAVGPGVAEYREGDRVIAGLDISCGTCAYCRIGELDHCARIRRIGIEANGSLAEYMRAPAANLIRIPDSVSFTEAAPMADAVGSPYHAVMKLARVRAPQTVAVYGLGGLGFTAVQVAGLAGAKVIAIARTPERRKLAEELGATWSIDPNDGPVAQQIRDVTDGLGVHAFFDFVGIEGSVEQAVLASRKGGQVVVVGYFVPELKAPMMRLVYDEVSIKGSRGSTRGDLHEAVELVGQGRIKPIVGRELALEDVHDALTQLEAGSIIGRAVVNFD